VSRYPLLRFVLIGASATYLVATFCPIWTLLYVNPREGLGVECSFWFVLWECLRPETFPVTRQFDPVNAIVAGFIFLGGALLGATCWLAWRLAKMANTY
jgi:hypothetical protein